MEREIDESDVHIGPNQDFIFEIPKGFLNENQFFADAAEKLRAEEIAGAGLLDEGRVKFEAFGHRGGEDLFEKHPVGRGVAAEEMHCRAKELLKNQTSKTKRTTLKVAASSNAMFFAGLLPSKLQVARESKILFC